MATAGTHIYWVINLIFANETELQYRAAKPYMTTTGSHNIYWIINLIFANETARAAKPYMTTTGSHSTYLLAH